MPDPAGLDTAHEIWDRWWRDANARAAWIEPEPAVLAAIERLREMGAHRVLDLGAGIGRHALAYARAGLDVVAVDASRAGLDQLARVSSAEGIHIELHQSLFTRLPVEDRSVDHVLAWNVLYHGDTELVVAAFRECRRVLSDSGTFQFTMLSKRHRAYGVGQEIRRDTFVDPTSNGDKDHPHLYVDAATLAGLVRDAGFEVVSMADIDQRPPGQWHWTVLAETTTTH